MYHVDSLLRSFQRKHNVDLFRLARPLHSSRDKKYSGTEKRNRSKRDDSGIDVKDDSPSKDPWKVLIKKLDSSKSVSDKEKFGKVEKKVVDVPDMLQCRHFETCSGCSMKGNFTDAPIVKQARSFFKSESITLKTHIGNHHNWRTHVKLAVQPLSRWGGLKIGLYKAGSHEVEAIPGCR